MTGIARIKVNLAATVRETPIISPPTMVAPEREVPGKTAAISWKMPMRKASLKVRSRRRSTLGTLFLFTVSIIMKAIPTTISAMPTTIALYRCASSQSSARTPTTPAGMQATRALSQSMIVCFLTTILEPPCFVVTFLKGQMVFQ